MVGWKITWIPWLLAPVLLLALAAPAQAGPAHGTGQCLPQIAAADRLDPALSDRIDLRQEQRLLACRSGCARSCGRRYRCRRLPPRQRGACYSARAACLRGCGC